MKNVLAALLVIFNVHAHSQDTLLYEQVALNFFIDSLMDREISKKSKIYIVEKINDRPTVLLSSRFYKKDNADSIHLNEIVKAQAELSSLNFYRNILRYRSESRRIRYINSNKISSADPDITLEVHKRNIYRPGKYVVELVVRPSLRRDHFFFEIDSKLKTVQRWVVIRHKMVRSTYEFRSLPY